MLKNKHGLSRDIPESVKRQVRQDCGFGCVVCATALYEYEHIDPTFAEARDHRAECIGLLCPNCHAAVTRGLRSKEEVKRAREHPACLARGFSQFGFQFEPGAPLDVILGRITFRGVENILAIDGTPILAVCPPRHPTEPPLLSAVFFDRNETTIAKVIENEWQGSADAFDITTRGALFSIRSELRKIDLVLAPESPRCLRITRLQLRLGNTEVIARPDGQVEVRTGVSSLTIPSEDRLISKPPLGLNVVGGAIHLGQDKAFCYLDASGQAGDLPGVLRVENADVSFVDPMAGIEPPPGGWSSGKKLTRVQTRKAGAGVSIEFQLPQQGSVKPKDHPANVVRKVGRNDPCPCGSGKKHKRCHG